MEYDDTVCAGVTVVVSTSSGGGNAAEGVESLEELRSLDVVGALISDEHRVGSLLFFHPCRKADGHREVFLEFCGTQLEVVTGNGHIIVRIEVEHEHVELAGGST